MAREAVALVSSCEALPWMMEVMSSLAFWRTRFQTLITSPQVVSTILQPISLMRARVVTSVPKAGTMTTSSAVQVVHLGLGVFADEILDAERADLLVDLGVVDDLAEDEEAAVGEDLGGGVGEVDGALHAVAKAELLRELHGHVRRRESVPPAGAELLHDLAAVVGLHLRLHRRHDVRRAEIDAGRGRSVGRR